MQQIQFQGHGVKISVALREYIFKKLKRIKRYTDKVTSVHVDLKFDKKGGRYTTEVRLHVPGAEIYALAEENDMHAAIDSSTDKLVKQLKVYKSKRNDRKMRQKEQPLLEV
jgi:putative sigma-54 modulation protein